MILQLIHIIPNLQFFLDISMSISELLCRSFPKYTEMANKIKSNIVSLIKVGSPLPNSRTSE